MQYQKKKKIVTGRDVAATWHIAFCNDLRRTHCTNSTGSGDQSVLKRAFLSRRQTPTVWFQTWRLFFKLTTYADTNISSVTRHSLAHLHRWCLTHCTCPCLSVSAACVTGDANDVTTDNDLQSECGRWRNDHAVVFCASPVRCRTDHTVVFRAPSLRGSSVWHQTQKRLAQGLPCSARSCDNIRQSLEDYGVDVLCKQVCNHARCYTILDDNDTE